VKDWIGKQVASLFFFKKRMENKELEQLKLWAEEFCAENDLFIVKVSAGVGKITVSADSMENITIQQCTKLSRFLLGKIEESGSNLLMNYTLDVSSPGMSNSLILPAQFKKRLNKNLNISTKDGLEMEAKVIEVSDEGIVAELTIPANKKKKEPEQKVTYNILYTQITKALIPLNIAKKLKP
jgi:ribosome maturation factor RimP